MEHPQETMETVPMKHEGFEENPYLLSEHLFRGGYSPNFPWPILRSLSILVNPHFCYMFLEIPSGRRKFRSQTSDNMDR